MTFSSPVIHPNSSNTLQNKDVPDESGLWIHP